MNLFDILFYNVFSHYKVNYKQKANNIAVMYVSILQCALLFLLGVFFAGFFRNMSMTTMSQDKAWTLFVLLTIFIVFKNWMQYTGKRRMMVNAKMIRKKKELYSIWLLWFFPVAVLGLTYVVSQAI